MAEMAILPPSASDLHNLYVLADAAVTLLNQQQQQMNANAKQDQQQQQKKKKKKNVKQDQQKKKVKKTSKKKQKRPSPLAPRSVQLQQRAPEGWLLELVAEHGGMRPPAFLCAKKLTISDTNRNLNRFAIPRNIAYDVLRPLMDDEEWKSVCSTGGRIGGGGLRVQSHYGVGSVTLCFKLWESNLMFLFNDGWKHVVERNGLRPQKDVVEVWCFRDFATALHFAFCVVRGEEGGVVRGEGGGGEEEGRKNDKEDGLVEDGLVVLEEETTVAMKDDNIVSVEEENEEDERPCHRIHKKRRTICA